LEELGSLVTGAWLGVLCVLGKLLTGAWLDELVSGGLEIAGLLSRVGALVAGGLFSGWGVVFLSGKVREGDLFSCGATEGLF
jgi:hypothetical protein